MKQMERSRIVALAALIVMGLLAGCGQAAPTPVASAEPVEGPGEALSTRNQLLLGTLRLEETDLALTAAQARVLLPLWQGVQSLSRSGTSSEAEMDALMEQIRATYTAEQLDAISAMLLTREDLETDAAELGITFGEGEGAGQGMGQGQGRNLTDAERAAREAERAASGATPGRGAAGGGANAALIDYMIQMLAKKAG